jgi:hypothetical protein
LCTKTAARAEPGDGERNMTNAPPPIKARGALKAY